MQGRRTGRAFQEVQRPRGLRKQDVFKQAGEGWGGEVPRAFLATWSVLCSPLDFFSPSTWQGLAHSRAPPVLAASALAYCLTPAPCSSLLTQLSCL